MNIQFVTAAEKDIPLLLDMMGRFYAIDQYQFDEQVSKKNFSDFLSNENLGKAWLILDDDHIIGYVVLTWCFSFVFQGRTGLIDELFLEESYRGKGIGGMAIDFIDAYAQEHQLKALHLEVEHHNEKGWKLYVKKGFREHERVMMTKKFLD